MNAPEAITGTAIARRPLAIWALFAFLILRIAADAHSLLPARELVVAGPAASRSYNLYVALISLALFRFGTILLTLILLWRRHWVGLVIAALFFLAEAYSEVLRDLTGGMIGSAFGPPATEGDAIARAVGRYTMILAPLALLAWCSVGTKVRRYFQHAI